MKRRVVFKGRGDQQRAVVQGKAVILVPPRLPGNIRLHIGQNRPTVLESEVPDLDLPLAVTIEELWRPIHLAPDQLAAVVGKMRVQYATGVVLRRVGQAKATPCRQFHQSQIGMSPESRRGSQIPPPPPLPELLLGLKDHILAGRMPFRLTNMPPAQHRLLVVGETDFITPVWTNPVDVVITVFALSVHQDVLAVAGPTDPSTARPDRSDLLHPPVR